MIAEVKGARLLRGFRGRPAADLEALADTLVRVSHLAMHIEGHLAELDINPLMVLPSGQGVKAVDALVVFAGAMRSASTRSIGLRFNRIVKTLPPESSKRNTGEQVLKIGRRD